MTAGELIERLGAYDARDEVTVMAVLKNNIFFLDIDKVDDSRMGVHIIARDENGTLSGSTRPLS